MKCAFLRLVEMAVCDGERAATDNARLDEAAGIDADHGVGMEQAVEIIALALFVDRHGTAARPNHGFAERGKIDVMPLLEMGGVGADDDIGVGGTSA